MIKIKRPMWQRGTGWMAFDGRRFRYWSKSSKMWLLCIDQEVATAYWFSALANGQIMMVYLKEVPE